VIATPPPPKTPTHSWGISPFAPPDLHRSVQIRQTPIGADRCTHTNTDGQLHTPASATGAARTLSRRQCARRLPENEGYKASPRSALSADGEANKGTRSADPHRGLRGTGARNGPAKVAHPIALGVTGVVVTGPFLNFLLHNHFITEKFYKKKSGEAKDSANFSFFILLHKRAKPMLPPCVHFSNHKLIITPWY
jgi:hypothetical protein